MRETLKKVTTEIIESKEKSVTLCLESKCINLSGTWNWNMQSPAVYCSDVMSFPDDFIGTKAIVHPDDLPNLKAALSLLEEREVSKLDFRIITTYGEVKTISGQRVFIDDGKNDLVEPVPGKEPWEEFLQQLASQKETEFLRLRNTLVEFTERIHNFGSWLINKNTLETWFSDNVFRIHGLAPQSINAHSNAFNQFIFPEDRTAVREAMDKAYEEEIPVHIEYRIVLPDGDIRYVQQVTNWIYSVKGHAIFSGILRDVTEERLAVNELLATQSTALLHQNILKFSEQQTSTGYWHINLATRKASYSVNYNRIYGVKQGMLPDNNSFLNFVHPDDRTRVREITDQMYKEHVLQDIEFRIIRPDGKLRILKQSAKLLISAEKEMVMVGLVQDVTIQKGLEKKIAELGEHILLNKIATELSETAIGTSSIMWLPDGHMQWSDGFYSLLGYKPGSVEALQRVLHKSIHPEDLKIFKDAESSILNGQDHPDIVVRFISRSGIRQTKIWFRQFEMQKELMPGLGVGVGVGVIHDITNQTKLLEEYEQNKTFVEFLSNSISELIILTNSDNIIMSWNKIVEERTGIRKEDALYHNLFDVLPRLNEEEFLRQLHLALRGTETPPTNAANIYLRQAHNYSLYPLKNEKDEVFGVLHVVEDVSEQLLLQQQLGERLNFIESLLEFSVDRIVALDRFMNYLYWNKKAEEYYAIPKERIIGKNILEVFPTFRNHPDYGEFRRVLKGETIYLPPATNESDEYFETYLTPIKNDSGDIVAVLWIVHDLTKEWQLQNERRKVEQEMKEANDLLRGIVDAPNVGITVMEAVRNESGEIEDFRIQFVNDRTLKAFAGNDPVGALISSFGSDGIEQLPYLKEAVETGRKNSYSRKSEAGIVEGWFLFSNAPFDHDRIVQVWEDITEIKKAEQQIISLKDEIAQKAEDKYQAIFNSINQGFSLLEILFDENGKAYDVIIRDANPAQDRIDGIRAIIGKRVKEIVPDIEMKWIERYANIVKTGVPENFEDWSAPNQRWYDVKALRVGGEESTLVAILYDDITERKWQKQRQEFLLQLSDALRSANSPATVQETAMKILGEHLKLNRAFYGEVMDDENTVIIGTGYTDGVSLMEGQVKLSEFDSLNQLNLYRSRQPLVIDDVYEDVDITPRTKEIFDAVQLRAIAGVGLLKAGKVRVIVNMHQSSPRKWTNAEIELLKETAERTWYAVERARAEETLLRNEERIHGQKEVLQAIINGDSPAYCLHIVANMVTRETGGEARCAFYIADAEGKFLHPVYSAGTMPLAYLQEIDGFEIGEDSLACGLAVPTAKPVITPDVYEEPRWEPWVYIADKYKYRGCWSFPIKTKDNKVVGTFAMYFETRHEASANDLALADMVTQTAAVIISTYFITQQQAASDLASRLTQNDSGT